MEEHHYYVYIVASRARVIYCGMTNNIRRRIYEHREGSVPGFSAQYKCDWLVWFEHYQYVNNAID
jgi:putative endonuclease